MKRLLKALAGLILFLAVLPLAAILFLQTDTGRNLAARGVSSLASSKDLKVSADKLSLNWRLDLGLASVVVSDADGPWLTANNVRIDWSPLKLLGGTLDVDAVTADELALLRQPAAVPSETTPGPPHDDDGTTTIIPGEIRQMTVGTLHIGSAILGEDLLFRLDGSASLEDKPLRIAGKLDLLNLGAEDRSGADGSISAKVLFAPSQQTLTFDLKAHEPAGGLLARLMDVPELPALDLELTGDGPLSDWAADLAIALDGRKTVEGRAGLQETGEGYRVSADIDGSLAPLVPDLATAFFIGTTHLTGEASLDEGFVPREGKFDLATETLTASGRGTFDVASGAIDARSELSVRAGDDRLIALDLPARRVAFGPVDLTTTVAGHIENASLHIALNLDQLVTTEGKIGATSLVLTSDKADLRPQSAAATAKITFTSDDVEPHDPDLYAFAGGVALRATISASAEDESARITGLRLTSPALTADLKTLTLNRDRLEFAGNAGIGNLDAFSTLTGQPLKGAVALRFDGKGVPTERDGTVNLSVNGRDLALGGPTDKLLNGATTLTATMQIQDLEEIHISSVVLKASGIEASGTGAIKEDSIDARITGSLPDMTRLHQETAGALGFALDIDGPYAEPRVQAELTSSQILLTGTALENLNISANATASATSPQGRLKGSGSLGGAPLTLNADLASKDGGATIRELEALIGGNRLSGEFTIGALANALQTLEGDLSVDAPDLSALSPLALRPLAGSLEGTIVLSPDGEGQAQIDLTGHGLAAEGLEIENLLAKASITSPFGAPRLTGDLLATRIMAGSSLVESAKLTAETEGTQTDFDADIRLTAGDAADGLSATGTLIQFDDQIIISLTRLDGRYEGIETALKTPASLVQTDGDLRVEDLSLALGTGTLSIRGTAGETLALAADLKTVPLALANAISPGLGIGGTLSGAVDVSGTTAAPQAQWTLQANELTAALLSEKNLPSLGLESTGRFSDGVVTQKTLVRGPDGLAVTAEGKIGTATPQSLNLALNGSLPLAFVRRPLTQAGLRAKGNMALTGSVTGTLASPQYSLSAVPSGVTLTELSTALTLKDVTGSIDVTPDRLTLSALRANLASGGSVSASGAIALSESLDADVRFLAERARYIDPGLVTAVVDADIGINGPLASLTTPAIISGTVTIEKADISIPETLPGAVPPVAVKHVNTPARVQAQLEEIGVKSGKGAGESTEGPAPRLDVKVSAPGRIFVRGRGLDAELYGDLTIAGTTEAPQAIGAFTLRRGQMDILTRRLAFSKGSATFYGSLTPVLDFLASTTVSSTTVNITVEGPADDPVIGFSSAPELPQDEVLALLLFGKEMGSLSPAQVAQLAAAIATLTGGSDSGPLAQIRKSLGLDAIDVNTGGEDGPSIGIGKYVNDNIYLGVEQGTKDAGSRVKVDIDLDRGLKVRGEVGADGSSKAGIFFEKEY
ncbi:translocation/assembly module TamB domain-containing protein [Roseibium sp.]|uniref:translocation/assembly module TamB domain-containing protein n=1 Tax=Roseibium sp. TaxID=1936156 RepID=UPI003A97E8AC